MIVWFRVLDALLRYETDLDLDLHMTWPCPAFDELHTLWRSVHDMRGPFQHFHPDVL